MEKENIEKKKGQQLVFEFQNADNHNKFSAENFAITAENENSFKFLTKFFAQKNFSHTPFTTAILKGLQGCGKTHLVNIFAKNNHATIITQNLFEIISGNYFVPNNFYIIEDIDEISDEETLLHLINSAFENKAFLLLTCKDIAKFSLRDLVSRLKNATTTEIKQPESETIKTLLAQGFAAKQLKVSEDILQFLTNNLPRSYAAIQAAIKMIEFFCHESKKSITLQKAKELSAKIFPTQ